MQCAVSDKDQLESDDLSAQRRSLVVAGGAVAAIAILGLSTALAVWTAGVQRESARSNELQAESRRLAAEALDHLAKGGPGIEPAVSKAVLAWRLADTAEARAAIEHINDRTAAISRVLGSHTKGVYKVALSPDGRVLATGGREGAVLRFEVESGRPLGRALAGEGWAHELRFSADGSHLLFVGHGRSGDRETTGIALFRLADESAMPLVGRLQDALVNALGPSAASSRGGRWGCVAVSATARRLAAGDQDAVVVMDVPGGHVTTLMLPASWRVATLGFAGDHRLMILTENVYGSGVRAARVELGGTSPRLVFGPPRGRPIGTDAALCGFSAFSADGRRVTHREGAWQLDDQLALTALLAPTSINRSELTGHHAPELDATGDRIAFSIAGTGYVWSSASETSSSPRRNSPTRTVHLWRSPPTAVAWRHCWMTRRWSGLSTRAVMPCGWRASIATLGRVFPSAAWRVCASA